jgi:hypothetical protein
LSDEEEIDQTEEFVPRSGFLVLVLGSGGWFPGPLQRRLGFRAAKALDLLSVSITSRLLMIRPESRLAHPVESAKTGRK